MLDLVMFDLDGTLIDTAPEITDTVNDVFGSLDLPPVDEAAVRGWIGHGAEELLVRACTHVTGQPPDAVRGSIGPVVRLYARSHAERCGTRSRPFPGVVRALRNLLDAGVRLAIITNKELALAESMLGAHRLHDYFERIIAGDSLPARKPDPLPIRTCLRAFGVAADHALYVGDSRIDVECGRNAGVACWIVEYGYDDPALLRESRPDRLIPGLSSVVEAVNRQRRPGHAPGARKAAAPKPASLAAGPSPPAASKPH